MNISLEGKHALIGGSSKGIGLAVARELAALGASCTLLARNQDALAKAVAELPVTAGGKHQYLVADYDQPEKVSQTVTRLLDGGPVHILINNTGGPKPGKIIDALTDEFEAAYRQHVLMNQLMCQLVVPAMKTEKFGRIVNIISTSVKVPLPNLGVSNTVRAAVAGWAKTLSNELAAFGITVNNVLPGFISTERLDALTAVNAAAKGISVGEEMGKMADSVPAGRIGTAEEIAAVAAFLCTPAAAYVTGESIRVDGGRTGSI
ncbi:SDR family oxidoreductase [Flavihumibacter petaseus]|uniref:Putative oxidoreductase n=1 Tax=Flavihumibacter petaseus NBRC 106054 TaxID=1220578 RepID=A0A0E9N6H5_9BACT|nr:SDR family oxidoreductase [Flavihumibacter petaseus]GAO45547.1 putative oxidoreductase [Flavihumibacter petaseus NBRC 106054]